MEAVATTAIYVNHNGIITRLVVPSNTVNAATTELLNNSSGTSLKTCIGTIHATKSPETKKTCSTRVNQFIKDLIVNKSRGSIHIDDLNLLDGNYILVLPKNVTSSVRRAVRMLNFAVKESDAVLKNFKQRTSAPKKPKRAIDFFQSHFHTENKGSAQPFYEISKAAREKWKTMSDQEKQHYQDLAQKEVERYESQMIEWKKNFRTPPKKAKPTYSLYLQDIKRKGGVPQWKKLSEEDKEVYRKEALKEKERYANEMTSYNNWLATQHGKQN